MPQKLGNKKGKLHSSTEVAFRPPPPNVFLYVQLAHVGQLPDIQYPLEMHLDQGGSLIVKCVDNYNTEGIIAQDEFTSKPTFTLILQQDNLDQINQAADNPLLIKLYMCKIEEVTYEEEADLGLETETSDLLALLLDKVETTQVDYFEPRVEMILLSMGYLDIIKLFGHHRCLMREELLLYPVPECPMDLRYTMHTEWHLYTLVPIAKEVTFTNMTFITFESIYNLKEEYTLDLQTLNVQLSFRSVLPVDRQEYHVIPLCSFTKCYLGCIETQDNHHVFEFFRNSMSHKSCPGLRSPMSVEMHQLFSRLMRSENMNVDFDLIKPSEDLALVFNSFHRFILTKKLSDILFTAIARKRYVIAVDVWNMAEIEKKVGKKTVKTIGNQKIFWGILDPAVLLFPAVQNLRFAVELKYLGTRKKLPKIKAPVGSVSSNIHKNDTRYSAYSDSALSTFAIIQICLLAPLGEFYTELKIFRESFISQNRLLFCDGHLMESKHVQLRDIQQNAYSRFDQYMRNMIHFIVDKKVHSLEEKRGYFCCALQNLNNILLKVVGCDFNQREKTANNVEFTNLCAMAYNELELRVHNLLEKIEDDGLDDLIADSEEKIESLIDHMNSIKLLNAVGDKHLADHFYEEAKNTSGNLFEFFDLIARMERGEYASAKTYFESKKLLSEAHEYFAGWIRVYLDYIATRDDPNQETSAKATECLLNNITKCAERYKKEMDGWILLYCYYKRFNYPPGYSFARWHLEDKLNYKRSSTASAPLSLFGISMRLRPKFEHRRGHTLFESFRMFVRLGLFEFSQVIFDEMQHEWSKPEIYMIGTQLKILLNQLDEDFEVTTFSFEDNSERNLLVSFNAQINGNVEYHLGNFEIAAEYYAVNIDQSQSPASYPDHFMLSKIRLAYLAFDAGNYQQTIDALGKFNAGKLLSLAKSFLMGKAYYKLKNLNKAMECFVKCTTFGAHVPNVWGFLALINLRMGNNLNALSCWKHARIDPTKSITDEIIFDELEMIDTDIVDLYIDGPSLDNSASLLLEDNEI